MTYKQVRTLNVLDICSNVFAIIQIMVAILIITLGNNSDINYFFIFTIIISIILIKKVTNKNK